MKPIVVGLDLSPQSLHALHQATDLARRESARVVLVHAEPPPSYAERLWGVDPIVIEEYKAICAEQITDIHRRLRELEHKYELQGIDISLSLFSEKRVEEALLSVAEDSDSELIVVGSHGTKRPSRVLSGRVRDRVVRRSDCDVLITRGKTSNRILIATDFSNQSQHLVNAATRFCSSDTSITFVHCIEPPFHTESYVEAISNEAVKTLDIIAEPLREKGLTVVLSTPRGFAAESIIHMSADYDIVFVGRHGHHGFLRFLLGGTTEKIVRHASCSVYVVHLDVPEQTKR